MDAKSLADLKARLERAREFRVDHQGRTYLLRLPDPFRERWVAVGIAGEPSDDRAFEQFVRDLVVSALVGWEGVTYSDLIGDKDDSLLAFEPGLVPLLIDRRLDILDALREALMRERQARRERLEADAGNSASASTGNSPRRIGKT
jgi:hypothetical protein